MPGQRSHWPVLPPAGHPADHQLGVDRQQDIRPDPHALDHARAITFDQRIGGLHQVLKLFDRRGILEIQFNPFTVAVEDVTVAPITKAACGARALNPDHPCAVVSQHHAAERTGPDPRQFDHRNPSQNPCHRAFLQI